MALHIIDSSSISSADSKPLMHAPRMNRLKLSVALALSAVLAPTVALADPQDTLNFSVGAGMRLDDNLFRLDDSQPKPAGIKQKSDQIYITNLGIKIDKPYSLQRFQFNFTATDNKYQQYDYLDHTTIDYRAAWLWALTPRITGVLSSEQTQFSSNFADFRGSLNRKTIQTNQVQTFSIDGDIGAGVHLIGALTELRSRNTQNFAPLGDYIQDGAEAGVKYVSRAENWVSLVQRESRGEYQGRGVDLINFRDNKFDQHETEARFYWKPTGKSSFDGRLGYVNREHDHVSQRDFSGPTGQLTYHWTPTGKLQINTSLTRNLYSFQESFNDRDFLGNINPGLTGYSYSYYVADTFSISPVWRMTAKTQLRARYDYSRRDYRGDVQANSLDREDDVQVFLIAADWQPLRTVVVNSSIVHEERDSTRRGFDYKANSFFINAQLLF